MRNRIHSHVATLLSILLLTGFAWAAEPAAGDSCQIRNQQHGNLLRPENASNRDGASIVLYPRQSWKCLTWKLESESNGEIALRNHFTSKSLGPQGKAAEGVVMVQVPWDGDRKGKWKLKPQKDGSCLILEAATGLALTAESGSRVVLSAPTGVANQCWIFEKINPADLTM